MFSLNGHNLNLFGVQANMTMPHTILRQNRAFQRLLNLNVSLERVSNDLKSIIMIQASLLFL